MVKRSAEQTIAQTRRSPKANLPSNFQDMASHITSNLYPVPRSLFPRSIRHSSMPFNDLASSPFPPPSSCSHSHASSSQSLPSGNFSPSLFSFSKTRIAHPLQQQKKISLPLLSPSLLLLLRNYLDIYIYIDITSTSASPPPLSPTNPTPHTS